MRKDKDGIGKGARSEGDPHIELWVSDQTLLPNLASDLTVCLKDSAALNHHVI